MNLLLDTNILVSLVRDRSLKLNPQINTHNNKTFILSLQLAN